MKSIHEQARDIPVAAEVDILVAGAGPAGTGAAIGAAKAGNKRVMLIEKCNSLGGMATSGMMSHWVGVTGSPEVAAIQERCRKLLNTQEAGSGWLFTIHHEVLKHVLAEYMEELGVTVQYHSIVSDVIAEQGALHGVITESKSGREAILAKAVIDASGDGDVAARAGAGFTVGRDGDHACQPATLMFRVGGVDYSRAIFPGSFETQVQVPAGEIQALARQTLPAPAGHTLLYRTWIPGEVCVNMTNVTGIDGTDASVFAVGDGTFEVFQRRFVVALFELYDTQIVLGNRFGVEGDFFVEFQCFGGFPVGVKGVGLVDHFFEFAGFDDLFFGLAGGLDGFGFRCNCCRFMRRKQHHIGTGSGQCQHQKGRCPEDKAFLSGIVFGRTVGLIRRGVLRTCGIDFFDYDDLFLGFGHTISLN